MGATLYCIFTDAYPTKDLQIKSATSKALLAVRMCPWNQILIFLVQKIHFVIAQKGHGVTKIMWTMNLPSKYHLNQWFVLNMLQIKKLSHEYLRHV